MLLFLFAVAALGGALNAVAGGGSFLTLPALIFAGIPPVMANATSTFGMWPASVASAVAYRREINISREGLLSVGLVSVLGGLLGGLLLIRTSNAGFMRLLPWLMLLAAVTFTFSGTISAGLARRRVAAAGDAPRPRGGVPLVALVLQLLIAIYGGYFGGGMGIMILASMAAAGMQNIHEMNGLKVLLAVGINGVALAEFVVHGAIAWQPGAVMVAGGILGGYSAAGLAQRIPSTQIRRFVIVVAWILTFYFFLRRSGF